MKMASIVGILLIIVGVIGLASAASPIPGRKR